MESLVAIALFFFVVFYSIQAYAQTPQSRYYFAIENLDTAGVVRRGLQSSNGIPSNGLILSPNTHFREWLLQADSALVGFSDFRTPASGSRFTIPPTTLHTSLSADTDGMSDDSECIVGSVMSNSTTLTLPEIDLG